MISKRQSVVCEMCLKTHNVKFHFKTNKSDYFTICQKTKNLIKYKNFCVIKLSKIVYTIFTSGHINGTGVKSFDEVTSAVEEFINQYNLCHEFCTSSIKIDNSTSSATVCLSHRIYLPDLIPFIREGILSLRPDFFPGAVLRRNNKCTIVIFTTGRFIIIGAKSKEETFDAYNTICLLITKYHQQLL